jgi:hypothetical protein
MRNQPKLQFRINTGVRQIQLRQIVSRLSGTRAATLWNGWKAWNGTSSEPTVQASSHWNGELTILAASGQAGWCFA